MAEKDKSIIERAILDAKRIQEALNANTKEILRSVAREEIDSIVKESLEEDYIEEAVEDEVADNENELEAEEADAEEADAEEADDELELDATEDEAEGDEEVELDIEDSEEEGDDLEGDYVSGMDVMASGDEDEMDMTGASDEDVIAVYKKLTGNDEIEVVYNDDELEISVHATGDYLVKNVEAGEAEEEGESEESEDELDEVMYEIGMDEEYMEEESMEDKSMDEEYMEEEEKEDELDENSVRSLNNGRNQSLKPQQFPDIRRGGRVSESSESKQALTEAENKYKSLLAEANDLKGKNEEYKNALKQFRTMLAETVVFNSNLTYVTKLFMEHSTTKSEKQTILKRFDEEVSTLKESKRLYKTVVNELSSRANITESVDQKINKEVATSTSKQLNESTAYVDKGTLRIMDLIRRVENK
jgi:hypothetical protein